MCKKLLTLVLVMALVGSVSAAINWNGSESTDWNTGANWDGGLVPVDGDNVYIQGGYPRYPILDVETAALFQLWMPHGIANLDIVAGGHLHSTQIAMTWWNDPTIMTLDMSGGQINGDGYGDFYIGTDPGTTATANVSGASLVDVDALLFGGFAGGAGPLRLNISGTAKVKCLRFIPNAEDMIVDVSEGGVLQVAGDHFDEMLDLLMAGKITAGGTMMDVMIFTTGEGESMNTFVVPEPATMMLLGLGGLALIRRKRA